MISWDIILLLLALTANTNYSHLQEKNILGLQFFSSGGNVSLPLEIKLAIVSTCLQRR